jgi:N-acetylmuramoyl-L-alanine amidase
VLVCVPGLPHPFAAPKDAVTCLAVAVALAVLAVGPGLGRPPAALAAPLAAWICANVVSSAATGLWTHTLAMRMVDVALFLVALSALGAPAARRRLAAAVVIAATLDAALAVAQYVAGPAVMPLVGATSRRWYAFGTLGVPNWVGALSAMALAPALVGPARRRALAVPLLVTSLAVTGSRGAWAGAAAGLAVVRPYLDRRAWTGVAASVVLGALVLTGLGAPVARTDGGSIAARRVIWSATVGVVHAHPVVGAGPGGFAGAFADALEALVTRAPRLGADAGGLVDHAHDVVLHVLAETGVVGLLAFLAVVVALGARGVTAARGDRDRRAALGTLAAVLVYGLVDDPFQSGALAVVAWLSAGALVAPDAAPGRGLRAALVPVAAVAAAYGLLIVRADRALRDGWHAAAMARRDGARSLAATAAFGPARGEADLVAGLVLLADGDAAGAKAPLLASRRVTADLDVHYALATAVARTDGPAAGIDILRRIGRTLPRLVAPRAVEVELRRTSGAAAADVADALARIVDQPAALLSPRRQLFEAAAIADLRAVRDGDGPTGGRRVPPLVVVDPGHGGVAPGAHAAADVVEKTVTLQLAKRLAAALRAGGARVVLTRTRDRDVSLDARARFANRLRPDLFVSLHANAAPNPEASGVEVHVRSLDPAHPPFAGLTPRDDVVLGALVPRTLATAEAARRALDGCALRLAADVTQSATADGFASRGVRGTPLYLLERVQAPAVLVEVGFLSNPADARALARASWQRRITAAIARAGGAFLARHGACEAPASP